MFSGGGRKHSQAAAAAAKGGGGGGGGGGGRAEPDGDDSEGALWPEEAALLASAAPLLRVSRALGVAPSRCPSAASASASAAAGRRQRSRAPCAAYAALTFCAVLAGYGYNLGWEVAHGFPDIKGVPAKAVNVLLREGGRRELNRRPCAQVMFIFMCILYDVYQLMGLLARGLRESLLELLAYAAWDAVHLAQLVTLTTACHLAAAHAAAASREVTRLVLAQPPPPPPPAGSAASATEELHSFSLQLLHSRLEFSACGLFAFDLRMLCAFAGAATTYLVIVMQY